MRLLTQRESLFYYTKWSLAFHCAFLLLFSLSSKIMFHIVDGQKAFNLKLVEGSVRVDVVDMPKITLQELKKLPSVSQRIKDTVPAQGVGDGGIELEQPTGEGSLAIFLKKLSRGKMESTPKQKTKRKNWQKDRKALRQLVLAGNKISAGRALTGKAGKESSVFEAYLEGIPELVRTHWSLPSYLGNSELKCRIRIYLNKEGKLLKSEIYESSGNEEYDAIALDAVKRTSFPVPDESFRRDVAQGNIVLGFPL